MAVRRDRLLSAQDVYSSRRWMGNHVAGDRQGPYLSSLSYSWLHITAVDRQIRYTKLYEPSATVPATNNLRLFQPI
jgi:hypothetical protein